MRIRILYIVVFFMGLHPVMQGQISPGPLSSAHAELEGIRNCTQCHSLGKKIDDTKCLACHKEIKSRIDKRTGYHASAEVKGKSCASCHNDHHGRNFDMIRFEEDDFNHNLTGYKLTGAHQTIDCRQCHIPDFIEDRELRSKKETYLGLSENCASCHEDYHQNTLASNDCAKCHNTEAFRPAPDFDHNATDFPLKGKHVQTDCIECHQKETRNGKEFQRFAGIESANCNSCHEDVHKNQLGTNCKQCHSEESFTALNLIRRFNHNTTGFALKGAHSAINCAECHNLNASLTALFQENKGTQNQDCNACHEDVHDNKFGTNCVDCHNEKSFLNVDTEQFNHSLTEFDLKGKHRAIDCRKCHTESFTDPLPHNSCASCHADYHEGDFANAVKGPDCAQCHSEEGFSGAFFSLEDHTKSAFPLEGAHIATPCFACHLQEDKWRFRQIGSECVDCHEDIHKGYIAEKFYPDQKCERCHIADSWFENHFDHQLTGFALLGKHAEAKCMDCHKADETQAKNKYEGFIDLPPACVTCHENVHDRQFEENGVTDCARCHGFTGWGLENFDHDQTAFKLEGAHAKVACEACHKPIAVEGETIIQYKIERFECIDCHQ